MKRMVVGGLLTLSLLFTAVAPATLASPSEPPPQEEEGGLGPLILGLLGPLPTGKETAFPYSCLDSCLNFFIPPCEPVLGALPLTLADILKLLNAVLDNPEAIKMALSEVIPILVEEPYIIINIVDMVLNPFSLKLCNPLYCINDPTVRGILEQVDWPQPCTSCMAATAQVVAMIIYNLPLRALTPLIPIIPTLLPALG